MLQLNSIPSLLHFHQNSRIIIIAILPAAKVETMQYLLQRLCLHHPCFQVLGLHTLVNPIGAKQNPVARTNRKLHHVGNRLLRMIAEEAARHDLIPKAQPHMVLRLIHHSLAWPLQIAPAVSHMGNGHNVSLDTCHHHRRSHLLQPYLSRLLLDSTRRLLACLHDLILAIPFLRMLLPVCRYSMSHRLARHFSASVTTHSITHDTPKAPPLLLVHDHEEVLIVRAPSLLTDCRIPDLHCLSFLYIHIVISTSLEAITLLYDKEGMKVTHLSLEKHRTI